MTALQLHRLRIGFNGYLEGGQTLMITMRILVATVIMAAVARGVWALLDRLLGRSLPAADRGGRARHHGGHACSMPSSR